MRKTYLEPEHFDALVDVFHEAQRLLKQHGRAQTDQAAIARRIIRLALDGLPPSLILNKILPPMSPEQAGLPQVNPANKIILPRIIVDPM
jgi:hypothetical protein